MANSKSARKRVLQNEKRRLFNLARRSDVKTAIKKLLITIDQKADASKAQSLLSDVNAKLARAKSKGIMHANTASRKISRLTKQFNKAFVSKEA